MKAFFVSTVLNSSLMMMASSAIAQNTENTENTATVSNILGDMTDVVKSAIQWTVFLVGFLGIFYTVRSLYLAYTCEDHERPKHLLAAALAGVISIAFVIMGWASRLFFN